MKHPIRFIGAATELLALPLAGGAIAAEASKATYPCIGMEYRPWAMATFVSIGVYFLLSAAYKYTQKKRIGGLFDD